MGTIEYQFFLMDSYGLGSHPLLMGPFGYSYVFIDTSCNMLIGSLWVIFLNGGKNLFFCQLFFTQKLLTPANL